jgi:hypothetical protein
VLLTITTPSSELCPHNLKVERLVWKKKFRGLFIIPFLILFVTPFFIRHFVPLCLLSFLIPLFSPAIVHLSSFVHPLYPLYPLIRIWHPDKSHKTKKPNSIGPKKIWLISNPLIRLEFPSFLKCWRYSSTYFPPQPLNFNTWKGFPTGCNDERDGH